MKNIILKEIIENHLIKLIEQQYLENQNRMIPYTAYESGFNSLVACSIAYWAKQNNYLPYIYVEAPVDRDSSKGRCDILWYNNPILYFFELKSSVFDNPVKSSIRYALGSLKYAKEQVMRINTKKVEENYCFHKIKKQIGCTLVTIYSTIEEGRDFNFNIMMKTIEKTKMGNVELLYHKYFGEENKAYLLDYHFHKYINDGLFLLGEIFTI